MDVESFLPPGINQKQTMKLYTLKNYFTTLALACLIPAVQAQFDDVYYDPDTNTGAFGISTEDNYSESNVTYYDDDSYGYYDDEEYAYYDDYDYYYSSRIRRFQRPYTGFGFYDPCYVSYNYYDPYYYDAYYYPGASIYISFGDADYWSYRQWRRWNRWNRWHSYGHWNSWSYSPSYHYYSYNSWCAPSYNYWGGYHGYHSYSNYYNSYYNSCPSPVSNYYGINHSTVTTVTNGGTRGSYYGPRVTGTTGSSPRGPVIKPENIQPVMKGETNGLTQSNDTPVNTGDGSIPRVNAPVKPGGQVSNPDQANEGLPPSRGEVAGGKEIPVDKEIKRDEVRTSNGRPIFKPYPNNDPPPSSRTDAEKPRTPSTDRTPSSPSRDSYTPSPARPSYQPPPRNDNDRPRYTPPSRNDQEDRNDQRPGYSPRNDDRPSYTPPSRNERNEEQPSYSPPARNERNEDRPSYSPPSRNNDDRPSYSPPQRSEPSRNNDRPSYSPPSRNDSSPGRDHSPSGSSRSSSPSGGGSPRTPSRG